MEISFGLADVLLVLVVGGMALGMAYVHSPRMKALIYMLPLPFSVALTATGRGVDATHAMGLVGVWGFVWLVLLLHKRLGMPIVLADIVAIAVHCTFSLVMARVVPQAPSAEWPWFWVMLGVLVAVGVTGMLIPHVAEPGNRSAMPAWIKGLLVLVMVTALILAKKPLRGFMPSFPMATVFAVYEARHSLRTLGTRFATFLLGFVPMAVVLRLLLPEAPIAPRAYILPLVLAWCAYIPVYLLLDRVYARRGAHDQDASDA